MSRRPERRGGNRGTRWARIAWGGAAVLLILPLAAMQVTDEMNWGPGDFVLFAALLVAACGTFELAARAGGNGAFLAGAGLAVATALLLVWGNLAVGAIGDEGNPANLMFAGVIAIGLGGALAARGRPRGMAWALVATAGAQAAVGVVAALAGFGTAWALTGAFVLLWLAAAGLFARAARCGAAA